MLARESWTKGFSKTLMSKQGRALPVNDGAAWIVGRCAIHLAAEDRKASKDLAVHVVEEPRSNHVQQSAPFSQDFQFELARDDPYLAATMVLRWIDNLEGD